ncbi:hypothetical protein BaRGS_00026551, partial [Batillaria attramentaria]
TRIVPGLVSALKPYTLCGAPPIYHTPQGYALFAGDKTPHNKRRACIVLGKAGVKGES